MTRYVVAFLFLFLFVAAAAYIGGNLAGAVSSIFGGGA